MQPEQLEHLRHSLAHLLAAAVLELYPDAQRTIGPAIDDGFYYDFNFSSPVSEDDLPKIEAKMRELMPTFTAFQRDEVDANAAREAFDGNKYKIELIDEFSKDGQTLTLYRSGNYVDLCRGGHAERLDNVDPECFTLTKIAGAYWRGDEHNDQLTRIYAVAFATKAERDAHLAMLEEAKKRDHRKLGKELGLFTLIEEIGGGLPLFYPKGAILRRTIENLITNMQESRGYTPIWIPHITKGKLYEMSGHLQKYDAMYPPMVLKGEDNYYLKPMNCPHFMMLYKTLAHSYKDLPVRWVCTTTNYRYEKSGELSGLARVRALTQDDCHVFVMPEQIESEINIMLDMLQDLYRIFDLKDFWVRISTHDPKDKEKYIGDDDVWQSSEAALEKLIKARGWKFDVGVGEAAFYGPKLDFMFKDALGREWQLSTIQLDMNLPERFDLEYMDSDNKKKRPVVIHRALLGSVERFLGIMIEHYAGAFPMWLAPEQIRVATVAEEFLPFATALVAQLSDAGLRVALDDSSEKVGKKIRNAAMAKVPWTIVVGAKEVEGGDYKVNVFGQTEDILIAQSDLVQKAIESAKLP